jgi:hypothetical protein
MAAQVQQQQQASLLEVLAAVLPIQVQGTPGNVP